MLDNLGLILGLAGLLLAIRVSGFFLADLAVSPRWRNFLRYTPYGALTALVVSGLTRQGTNLGATLPATALAVVAVRLTRQIWPGIVAGILGCWLLSQFV